MHLGKPSFPILVSSDDVVAQIQGQLKDNRWEDAKVEPPKLVFYPYWLFHFDSFLETTDPGTSEKATQEGEKGTSALNALDGELEEDVATKFDSYSDQLILKPEVEKFRVERSHFKEEEVQKLAQLKTAARLGIAKDNVVISGLRQIYFPVWATKAAFEENEETFEIDAVDGEMIGDEEIPFKGKTASELAHETVSDLFNPANWIKYLIGLIKTVAVFLWTNPASEWTKKQFLTNRNFQIAILAVVLVLILLNEL